jgi:hypothetical protein
MGAMVSPLTGPAGNVEFLLHARKGVAAAQGADVGRLLDETVGEAASRRNPPGEGVDQPH